MGKRKNKDPEYIKKKIRKLEKQLKKNQEEAAQGSPASTSQSVPSPPTQEASRMDEEEGSEVLDTEVVEVNTEEELPQEILEALGHEGEDKDETTQPIRSELALRWSKIMTEGLKKEQREALLEKYPQPINFQTAIAPILNKEISASLSEIALNRDKRMVARQNILGKLISCLGKSLTEVLKGNINSKKIVEEVNDAAKIAAELFYAESTSRRFFALSSASKPVQETCKDLKPSKFLFGDNLTEHLKAIESVKRTANQIRVPDKKPTPSTTSRPKQLNWRGPSQNQQSQRGRGGRQPTRRPPARQYNHRSSAPRSHQRQQPRKSLNQRRY